MAESKTEPRINIAVPKALHTRLEKLLDKVDSPYGRPTLQGLLTELLRGAIEQAEKRARA